MYNINSKVAFDTYNKPWIDAKEIMITDEIEKIDDNMFSYCFNLTKINIPEEVKEIGKNAFAYCLNLESIAIPDSVEIIDDNAFAYCFNLKNIIIHDNIIIKNNVFTNCFKLNVIYNDRILRIPIHITEFIIPEYVAEIEDFAFSFCKNLRK